VSLPFAGAKQLTGNCRGAGRAIGSMLAVDAARSIAGSSLTIGHVRQPYI
jgi:hypothetical protein